MSYIPEQIHIYQYFNNLDKLLSHKGCDYGKTSTMVIKMLDILLNEANTNILYFGYSWDICNQINREMAMFLDSLNPPKNILFSSPSRQILLYNNSRIRFLTFTRNWECNIRGYSYSYIFNDSRYSIRNDRDIYDVLLPALYISQGSLIE